MDFGDCRFHRRIILLAILATGCGPGDRRPADLQLDIEGAALNDTDNIRVCIEGALIHETTVGDGRIALSGIPTDGPVNITVNALNDEQSVGGTNPIVLNEEAPWASTIWTPCDDQCTACSIEQASPSDNNNSRMLAIHFIN